MQLGTLNRKLRASAVVVACLVGMLMTVAVGPAAAGPIGPHHYVALGDSYTSGPGIPNQEPEAGACRRSDHNYPSLVAAALEAASFTDASCAGATTAAMTGPQPLPGGLRAGPQLDVVGPDTDLVTLGVGGNDIGFGEITLTCAALSLLPPFGAPCRHHFTRHGDEIGVRIDTLAPKVGAVLAAIRARAPAARILVVGYPVILPAAGPGCWPVMPIAIGDVAWLRGVEGRLNAMLAGEAAGGGATFVDTYGSSVGHDVCQFRGDKWVEGFVPTAPASAVHPNARGMENTARQVVAALTS